MAAHDLMMQIPFIFRQPGSIKPGRSNAMVTNYDFLPSVLDHIGLENRIPTKPKLAGRSFAPILNGEDIEWETKMAYEMEGTRSFRTEDWKIVLRKFPTGPSELYDMKNDPNERFNLYGQPEHAVIQAELGGKLNAFYDTYADPKYDIWNGGGSKARRHAPDTVVKK